MLKRNIKVKPCKKKAQSTIEYIILVAAVIGALLVFLPGTFSKAYNTTLESGTTGMTDMAERLKTSRPLFNADE